MESCPSIPELRLRTRRRRKDGSEYDARLTVSPVLDAKGAIQCLVAHHEDISEGKATGDQPELGADEYDDLSDDELLAQLSERLS